MVAVTPRAPAAAPAVVRDALSFDRHYLPDPALLERIRAAKNLSGRTDPAGKERVLGWFEYDLDVPQAGWYELLIEPDAVRDEIYLDGAYQGQCATSGPRAGSFRLDAGKHTLRIQKFLWWDGFSPVTRIVLRPPEPGLARALRLHAATAPAEVRKRLATQISWVEGVVSEQERPEAKDRLKPDDSARLKQVATEARQALDAGQSWHARATLEWQTLALFRRCGSLPPFLRDDGPPATPAGVLDAAQLAPLSQPPLSVVESGSVVPDWVPGTLGVTDAPEWEFKLDAPVTARYRIQLGHAAGGDFGPVEVRSGDALLGRLEVWQPNPHGTLSMLPLLARWARGPQTLAFRRTGGVRTGVSFVLATPVVDDILALRWQRLGPFPVTSAKVEEEMAHVYPPETARNLDGTVDAGNGVTLRWATLEGFADFIDLSAGQPPKAGQVGYAVTHVFCPDTRQVRFSYGMDYWIKIWLNGKLIKDFEPHAGGAPFKGQFQLDAELRPGGNELLVKVASGSHGNGFWLAVTNPGDLRFAALP